jgi:fluoride exporter
VKGIVDVLWVGLGGFVGSSLRFVISGWVHRLPGTSSFPFGTLVVNVVGCLLVGLIGGWAEHRQVLSPATRLFLLIGVLGGFTTFSTFAYETLAFAHGADVGRALANVGLQVVLGLGAAWLGFSVVRGM